MKRKLLTVFTAMFIITGLLVACSGGNDGNTDTDENKDYTITGKNGTGYTVDLPDSAKEGDTVTVTVTVTNEDTYVTGVTYNEDECDETDGKYTFTMPAENVTAYAKWQMSNLGGELTDAGENNFENRRGIIKDLTLVADKLNVSTLAAGSYNGLFAQRNYGWIINCTVDGSSIGDRDESIYTPVIEGTVNNALFIGGFAGVNDIYRGGENDEGLYDGLDNAVGRIDGCTNMLDLVIESTNALNYKTYVGGIAGYNSAAIIVGSNNGISNMDTSYNNRAEISGYYAGGITGASVGMTTEVSEDEEVYVYSYISGCVNYGNVSTTNERLGGSSIEASTAGGIVGMANIAFTTYCMNLGTVSTEGAAAALGGIVGTQENGGFALCCVNIGDISYNKYYYDPEQSDVSSAIFAGAIVGMATTGNIVNVWYVQNSVVQYDNSGDTPIPTRSTVTIGANAGANTHSTNAVESFDKNDYVNAFLNGAEKINQVTLQLTQVVDCIYERFDGLVAQFAYTAGSNPTITWVDPATLR